NKAGQAEDITAADKLYNQTQFIFNRYAFRVGERFKADVSLSLNFANMRFENLQQSSQPATGKRKFDPTLMPRLASSYLLTPHLALRGIISRGYSLPTTAEIRANDAKINPDLEPEQGFNYETGIRLNNTKQTLYLDVSAFYYRMSNAIVQRINDHSETYFVNAGGTNQKGLEIQLNTELFRSSGSFLKAVNWISAVTLSDFTFRHYIVEGNDYSGNLLTGIPKH